MHGEGFINCDLKPENILLVNLDPILIDFGLIARNAPRESLEYGRIMAGTLPYMSPEQIRGEYVDARADLYSLGCMLYELLVGTPPFTGTPAHIKSQHLSSKPVPPSTRVNNLPLELDGIIRKLIEKDLPRRSGFADEVAASLSDLCDEEPLLRDFPPAKPYLYRPRFVGRDDVIAKLVDARDRAAAGSGSFVLLRGESGVGKTRVAMEMTRLTPTWPIQVVTSEVAPVAIEGATSVAPAPLQALRPLLRAVADRCQVDGPEMTERLLGPARSVLAKYEPLLADVPAYDPPAPLIPLSPEASRRHLFECLATTLAAVAAELPLLWVLDDVGWADELSLAFLESLTPAFFRRTAILVLCMHRSEEVSDRLDSIIRMPHVEQLRLSRLSKGAVGSIVSDMLALREPAPSLVEFVAAEAEGNPFFVAEYLRAAVSERLLHRDADHTWRLSAGLTSERQGLPGFESLGLPGSLRALIRAAIEASERGRSSGRDRGGRSRPRDGHKHLARGGRARRGSRHRSARRAVAPRGPRAVRQRHGEVRARQAPRNRVRARRLPATPGASWPRCARDRVARRRAAGGQAILVDPRPPLRRRRASRSRGALPQAGGRPGSEHLRERRGDSACIARPFIK